MSIPIHSISLSLALPLSFCLSLSLFICKLKIENPHVYEMEVRMSREWGKWLDSMGVVTIDTMYVRWLTAFGVHIFCCLLFHTKTPDLLTFRRQFAQISQMGLSTSLLLSSGWLKRSYSGNNVFTVTFESPLWICVSIKSWLLYIEFPSVLNELGMNVGICAAELLSHGATRLCASWWAKVNCIGPTLLRQESSTAACSEWIRKWPNVTQSNMQKRSLNKPYLF